MKATLFAAALALTASAAFAQTTSPGTQTGNPSTTNMPSNGTTTDPTSTSGRMDNMSGMNHGDKKAMRKSKKMKSNDGSMKTKTKM